METKIEKNLNVARQPIYDKNLNIQAYELLYRPDNHQHSSETATQADVKDEEFATLKVIANSYLMGLGNITYGKKAYINFAQKSIINKIPMFFNKDFIGIEILENVEPSDELVISCLEMKSAGYKIILDDFVYKKNYRSLLDLADIIKIDFLSTSTEEREEIRQMIGNSAVEFLAEKIETESDFRAAYREGFTYFQGYYFSKPDTITIPDIPGYKINYMRILKEINKQVLDLESINNVLKREIALTYRLLRFINSIESDKELKISTIDEALQQIHKDNLSDWISLIVLSSVGEDEPQELLNNTLIRAKFCELIAEHSGENHQKDRFFLFGMLSNLDKFLKKPMPEIVSELPLHPSLKAGLTGDDSRFNTVLKLIQHFEIENSEEVQHLADKIGIDAGKLASLYLLAIESGNLHF